MFVPFATINPSVSAVSLVHATDVVEPDAAAKAEHKRVTPTRVEVSASRPCRWSERAIEDAVPALAVSPGALLPGEPRGRTDAGWRVVESWRAVVRYWVWLSTLASA